ncbi:MAG: hypothetical protein CM15mP59_4160 [Flavobacteriaceae bacterium]|nr:MAG: hypothetical protein CM15mP59_4160 [Flavobacteriaceae bacterium]
MGNAVIGEWCNIGAGTDASNLKNNYGLVRVWDYISGNFAKTDLQFCGLMMGIIPNVPFKPLSIRLLLLGWVVTYLGMVSHASLSLVFERRAQGFTENRLDKVIEIAKAMKKRRGVELTLKESEHLQTVFQSTANLRN